MDKEDRLIVERLKELEVIVKIKLKKLDEINTYSLLEEIKDLVDKDRMWEDDFLQNFYAWQDSDEFGPPNDYTYLDFYLGKIEEKLEEMLDEDY